MTKPGSNCDKSNRHGNTKNSVALRTSADHVTGEKSEGNPFSVPNDEQLLALYHFNNRYKRPPDGWKLSHTLVDEESRLEASKQLEALKQDQRANLLRELKGRGAPEFFSRINYMLNMRKLAQCRLIVGVKRDGCIQLDQQADVERAKFYQIKREYKNCVNAMEQFLEEDHEASMNLLRRAEAEFNRTVELSERRDELSRRYGSTRLDVYHWEEAWRTVRTCYKFLIKVSENSDESYPNSTGGSIVSSAELADDALIGADFDYDTSLESLIASFEKETSELSKKPDKMPADLGLREADDLLHIFRTIELQNLNALVNLESLNGPVADIESKFQMAKVRVKTEIEVVLDKIKELEKSIAREEARARRLQLKSTKLVQRGFRALICSEQALRTRVLIEDAYEACVGPNEAGHDALFMAHGLEGLYEQLSAELDRLPRQLVLQAEREGFRAEMRASHEADEAVKKYELMNQLIASLRRLMEPTPPKYRKLMKRSQPPIRRDEKAPAAEKLAAQLAEDILHMELFGKACNARKALEKSTDSFSDED